MSAGFLLIDKPAGISSNQVLTLLKRKFKNTKFGHTGTLDPFATGLLVVGVNEALRFVSYLNEEPKVYEATLKLGEATDTMDLTGTVTDTSVLPFPPEEKIIEAAKSFLGDSLQTPPMYSAKKVEGVKLYEMARRGEEVERKATPIRIDGLEILRVSPPHISFRVSCSRGTYVRVLGSDLALKLGSVGHLSQLRRLAAGPFGIAKALVLENVENLDHLVKIEEALSHLPLLVLDEKQTAALKVGKVVHTTFSQAPLALALFQSRLVGLVEVSGTGELRVVRLLPTG